MKRVFSLALATLLLTGCTAAPADSSESSTAVTAETAAAQASTGNGEPLRLLQHGDEKQYYTQESLDDSSTMILYHVVDLQSGEDTIPCDVEGCTHDSESCPAVSTDVPAYYQIEANLNGWLVFYNQPIIVNAETGEVRQRADLPENLWNGYGHQPQIFLQLKDRLLVDCRYESYTRTDISDDGSPYTTQTEQMYLGLISIDDFLNGVPNYIEVCKGPY